MTKAEWKKHFNEIGIHDYSNCVACRKRRATKNKCIHAKALRQLYSDIGMVQVKGNLGGVYYE